VTRGRFNSLNSDCCAIFYACDRERVGQNEGFLKT